MQRRHRPHRSAPPAGRLEELLEQLTVPVLLFDNGYLHFSNHAARQIFPTLPGESGTSEAVLGHRGLTGALAEALDSRQPVDVEVSLEERIFQARAVPLREKEAALLVTDVTEAHRLEAMRRDFVTNASHELKTPAAAVQALAESLALAVDRDPARARQMIARLRAESQRLSSLVRELLDLSRLEERAASRHARIDVTAVVRQQVRRLADMARERAVRVHVSSAGPATVVGVPEDLRLVVANLLTNAIGYNRPGGDVHVSVSNSRGSVRLTVADTGIGISEADLARIFERFYRVDRARSRSVGGTGLGLSIVRHAIQRHGGEITVRSSPGEGSTFEVTLPVEGAHGR